MALEPRPLARRAAAIQPFYVMELLARARALEAAGRDIVHMEVGEPDFPTPAPIVEAGVRALRGGLTRYTPATGLPALREAISAFYQQRYDLSIAPARIVVTPGASGALQLAVAALVEAGAQVLMADPGYPCNRHLVRLVEGEVESLPVRAEDGFQPTVAAVQSAWSARSAALLLASPANPTGTLMPAERLRTIVDVVHRAGGRVVVDEVYHALVYGIAPSSALAVSDELFVVNSFSKYFGMTGWRLGWLVAPPAYIPCLERLAQNLFLAAPTPAQHAALAAFEPDTLAILEQRRRVFQQRRDYLLPALQRLGFGVPAEPDGAFYIYADCRRFSGDSHRFTLDLLDRAGVAITPGIDFGRHRARNHVRFAYTTSMARLEEGVARLQACLSR